MITLSRNNAYLRFGMKGNDLTSQFFEGIPCRSDDKIVDFIDIFHGESVRQSVAVDFSVGNEQIDHALLEPLLYPIYEFMIHGVYPIS